MAKKPIAPRRGQTFSRSGEPTLRMFEWMENITTESNETAAAVGATTVQILAASIFDLQARLGSGDFLTSDTDSFTVDSTVLFVDQTEA